jgi:hypothetical protein
VVENDGVWVKVRIQSFGEAGINYASIKVQAWMDEGFTTPKGHRVWFEPA